MSAKHGSAVSFRRLLGCTFALVLALSAFFAATASAKPITKTDLALGDSVAFGYSKQLLNENEKFGDPASAFEHGYANYYYNQSHLKEAGAQLTNDGCPGETTDSLIGNGPLATALGTEQEAPCAYHTVLGLPLHNEYGAGKSQLENALEVLAIDAATGKPVTTITMNIGANDELHAIAKCETEVGTEYATEGKSKYGATPEAAVKGCLEFHATELFTHIITNVSTIMYVIRNGATFGSVNYAGKFVFQGGYDPYGSVFVAGKELLTSSTALAKILTINLKPHVEALGGCYTDPLPTFNPLTGAEPARLQKWTNMANFTEFEGKANGPDIHPTPVGYQKLAHLMVNQCGAAE